MSHEAAMPSTYSEKPIISIDDSASIKTFNALCTVCKTIFTVEDGEETDRVPKNDAEIQDLASGSHHQTAQTCKEASDQGCPICSMVWLRATEYGRFTGILNLDLQKPFSTWSCRVNGSGQYRVITWPADRFVLNINIGSVLLARDLGVSQTFTSGNIAFSLEPATEHQSALLDRSDSTNTSTEESWHYVKRWIEKCQATCQCVGAFSRHMRPTRLIDVGENDGDLLYIRSEAELPQNLSYICLSHCWGGFMAEALYDPSLEWTINMGLPTTSIDQHGFTFSDRSKTLKDASRIVRKLGKRYMWVDMLCIVQNDVEDWKRESSKMGRIYKGAHLTLVADNAKDASYGLFNERNPDSIRPMLVRPKWNTEVSGQDWVLIPADLWQSIVYQSNTGQRAWCLQERFLSSAIIHFGQTQLAWECAQIDACETFPEGLPGSLRDIHSHFSSISTEHAKRLQTIAKRKEGQDEDDAGTQFDKYYIWSRLIEIYARTNITRDSDRQVAITGVGELFEQLIRGSLISGLWFQILPSQLLWKIDDGYRCVIIQGAEDGKDLSPWQPQGRRPSTVNAPTWSWASVNGPLIMPKPMKIGALVDLQALPRKDISTDSFEFHRTAMLVATGVLHKGFMIWDRTFNKWIIMMNPVGFGSRHVVLHSQKVDKFPLPPYTEVVEDPDKVSMGSKPPGIENCVYGLANPDTDASVMDVQKSGNMTPAYCLTVMNTKKHRKYALHDDPPFATCGISGLTLAPDPGGPQGKYIRLGTFDLFGYEPPQLWVSFEKDDQDKLFMQGGHRAIVLA